MTTSMRVGAFGVSTPNKHEASTMYRANECAFVRSALVRFAKMSESLWHIPPRRVMQTLIKLDARTVGKIMETSGNREMYQS